MAAKLQNLDAALAEEGRSRDDIDLFVGPNRHPVTAETIAAYAGHGVTQIVVPLGARTLERLEARADGLIALAS